ncbi:DsbA family protein [Mycobacterium vicinigordonae]|uniref:DsbA family protein n=1 Tax=Mycobacterium vicinigordonae TaxID=1719132 RepID=A0A7D6E044_9MYCO|nr:DsbA family protein [Mycobacterium vicinigordonae]QLL07710.1 DsbA family protein [Mycobacterium vicinigordonae]
MNPSARRTTSHDVTLWLDPVCPFSWNTARWLARVAERADFEIDWRLMNLAILNEGRELPTPQRARMRDSVRVGRLMAAVRAELGAKGLAVAYFSFGQRYFDQSALVSEELAGHLLRDAGVQRTSVDACSDMTLDMAVRQAHQASQDALGGAGGSPILSIDGKTLFGPVLTSAPTLETGQALFDALTILAATPEFIQVQRPNA